MVAFAANSILNRLALLEDAIGPAAFASIRVVAGVIVLIALLGMRERRFPRPIHIRLGAVLGLSAYMLGFSFAYVSMDAGLGALLLFAGVQITMFGGSVLEGDRPPARRWAGMALSMGGLSILSWPTDQVAFMPTGIALMAIAAFGWGVYSLLGRKATDPLAATAWNFVASLPIVLLALILVTDKVPISAQGVVLAVISGALTSGLGYALWYALLPQLGATRAGLAQLSAPAIALLLGVLLLDETITMTALLASMLILGGIAIGLRPNRPAGPMNSS